VDILIQTGCPLALPVSARQVFFMYDLHIVMKFGSHAQRLMLMVVLERSIDFGSDKLVAEKSNNLEKSDVPGRRMPQSLYTSVFQS
jgi:hypothetical protein